MDLMSKKIGNLPFTLATFVYLLHDNDIVAADENLSQMCETIQSQSSTPTKKEFIPDLRLFLQSRLRATPDIGVLAKFLDDAYPSDFFAEQDLNELGEKLVNYIRAQLPDNASHELIKNWLLKNYEEYGIGTEFGKSRAERTRNIKRYVFRHTLPFLVEIIDRQNRNVPPQWIIVEEIDERVHFGDPYRWDSIDEAFSLPIEKFHARWELAGLRSFRLLNPL